MHVSNTNQSNEQRQERWNIADTFGYIKKASIELCSWIIRKTAAAIYMMFLKKDEITLLHCMAYAWRMFYEGLVNRANRATYGMQKIQKLYAIERIWREKNIYLLMKSKQVGRKNPFPYLPHYMNG